MMRLAKVVLSIFVIFASIKMPVKAEEVESGFLEWDIDNNNSGTVLIKGIFHTAGKYDSITYEIWSDKDEKDDLEEGQVSFDKGGFQFTIYAKDHKNDDGEYHMIIHVVDLQGKTTDIEKTVEMRIENTVDEDLNVSDGEEINEGTNGTQEDNEKENSSENAVNPEDIDEIQENNSEENLNGNKRESSKINSPEIKKPDLVISNVNVTYENSGRYVIHAKVYAENGIEKVQFPTWTTRQGQDDIIWGNGKINGENISYVVDMKDHKYETGEYLTHIYAYDKKRNRVLVAVPIQIIKNEAPEIKDFRVDLNDGKYKITATITDDYELSKVQFPTWTEKNGKDDITWGNGTISGSTVTYTVDFKDHNYETGMYFTHVHAYDKAGMRHIFALPSQNIKNDPPEITDIQVGSLVNGKYTISATISDEYGLSKVQFPTWTEKNGKDDIVWGNGIINGNAVTYTVDLKDHNYENGIFISHIHAYDQAGNRRIIAVPLQNIKNGPPVASNIKVSPLANGKYTITADVQSDNGVSKVQFPTWTEKNGKDDIIWGNGVINGNTVTYTVDLKDHNYEEGNYLSHIHLYDRAGNRRIIAVPIQSIKVSVPKIGNLQVDQKAGKYIITATVTDSYGISKVQFPTWTEKNGKDDITWGNGAINGNTVTYTVDMKDHKYEIGNYITHMYVYNSAGKSSGQALPVINIKNATPSLTDVKVKNIQAGSYTVECNVSDDYGLDRVEFITWSDHNGKDDITVQTLKPTNEKVSITIYSKDHKYESGSFNTHIYVYDKAGKCIGKPLKQTMLAPTVQSGWQIINGKKYLFNRDGNVVNGANKLVIDISEHNGDIDWSKVKSSGVDAVILRCGYGWSDNLAEQRDAKFIKNAQELERLDIPYGIYLFSYECSESGAIKEAEYTLKLIQGRKISLPIYYDLEYTSYVGDLSSSTYAKMAVAYCERIKKAGYTPGIYANLYYWQTKLSDSSLDKYVKWIAQYNSNDGQAGHCDYTKPYKLWQYTSVGRVYGISTNVDMNAMY